MSTSPADRLKVAIVEVLVPLMKEYTDKISDEGRALGEIIKVNEAVTRMAIVNESSTDTLVSMKQLLSRIDGNLTALSEKVDVLDKKVTILSLKIEGSRRDKRNDSVAAPMNAFARPSGDLPSDFNCD